MLNKDFFEQLIERNFGTKTALAEVLGISISSINDWITRGTIPQNRLGTLFDLLKIHTEEDKDRLFNIPSIEICYRASKAGQEKAINPEIKQRANWIAKIFLAIHNNKPTSDLLNTLRQELKGKTDTIEIAQIIRKHFALSDQSPFVIDEKYYFLQNCGVNRFYLPFRYIGLTPKEGEVTPLAFTAHKNGEFFVLCDSDRSFDEMNFDSTHELIHILTGNMNEDDLSIEKWVDSIVEELIYPKAFLEKEFPFLKQDKTIKIKDFNVNKLKNLFDNCLSMSPRGFARALASYDYINKDLEVYSWLHDKLQEDWRRPTGSKIGKMNFDFSDYEKLQEFYANVVDNDARTYPLFNDLRDALIQNRMSPRTFGEIFSLDAGEVDELRKAWLKS